MRVYRNQKNFIGEGVFRALKIYHRETSKKTIKGKVTMAITCAIFPRPL